MNCAQWNAFGYEIRMEWEGAAAGRAVDLVVLPDWIPSTKTTPDSTFRLESQHGTISLYRNEVLVAEGISEANLFMALKRECHMELATHARDLVFVHAGVVLTPAGLLLIPARSFSGKSTLVKSLLDLGCAYYSDEYAVVDREGRVRPFPRALSMRSPNGVEYLEPRSLGWRAEFGPRAVSHVLCTNFERQGVWQPKKLTAGEALLKLLENTVSARTAPQRALQYLGVLVKSALTVQTVRGDADTVAPLILDWCQMETAS